MIDLECACGAHWQVLEVYAGGQVRCHGCGSPVQVPAVAGVSDDRFRFHCPHCESRVLARKASAGKKSECPACGKIYIIPDPPTDPELTTHKDERRISIDTDELSLRIGLPFPVGKLDSSVVPAPRPRYLHTPGESRVNELDVPAPPVLPGRPDVPEPVAEPSPDRPFITNPVPSPRSVAQAYAGTEADRRGLAVASPEWNRPFESPGLAAAPNLVVTAAAIPQISSTSKPASAGELQVLNGSCSGQRIPMDFRRFVVGVERDCDLRPASTLLSRHHCVFKKDEYAVRVRDLGSKSGTFVNGRRISSEVVLNPGDEVTVGDVRLHVVLSASPQVQQSAADSDPSLSDFVIL